jgi:hypothetical protein
MRTYVSQKMFRLLLAFSMAPLALQAQVDFKIDDRDVQVHGFLSQGFVYSGQNNFLTMDTSHGSFHLTDGALNVSSQITDNFRVGAQAYVRSIGELGHGHVELDWASADYKFKDWLGFRGGKVKTVLGLFSDSQDLEFLHTWALLPQAIYPVDLRSLTIAHIGGDVYGDIPLHRAGTLSYTVYGGRLPTDTAGGSYYNVADQGGLLQKYAGTMEGFDVHWYAPVNGLKLGASFVNQRLEIEDAVAGLGGPVLHGVVNPDHTTAAYADFVRGKWHLSGEYRRNHVLTEIASLGLQHDQSSSGFFVAAAYRVSKRLEVGAYNSRFYVDSPTLPQAAANHIFDQTITARVDINRFWNVKIEGHFMDGYGDIYSAHGFYSRDNPNLKPKTNMLIIRTGLNF